MHALCLQYLIVQLIVAVKLEHGYMKKGHVSE